MICALLLGREGSTGFPGKNIYPVLGRALASYPMIVAMASPSVNRLYVSTDSSALKDLGRSLGAEIIDRPAHLASKTALGEHAYVHGFEVIRERLANEGKNLEAIVLLFANAPTVTPQIIEEGIAALRSDPTVDSAVTVSSYNMWSPLRARRINSSGLLEPFVPFETFGDPKTMNCDRDSQGDVWFADMGVSIVRPRCLEHLDEGLLPQKWMGQKIYPLKQWGGFDVDEAWQIPMAEAWIQAHQLDKLFRVKRIKWAQFYESERTVLSLLGMDKWTRVLDLGLDPGGLGVALKERFGVVSYSTIVQDPEEVKEVRTINPEATILQTPLEGLPVTEEGAYDIVTALGLDDSPHLLDATIQLAYAQLGHGGAIVFTVRLTDKETVCDEAVSVQQVISGPKTITRQAYIVRNIRETIQKIERLGKVRISAYGYQGIPSSTAKTPFRTVCFAAFIVTRQDGMEDSRTPLELHLPKQIVEGLAAGLTAR